MLILDQARNIDGNHIKIPFYHRGHLSLKSGTTVTLALIPALSPKTPRLMEMVVSAIPYRSWPSLWRIEADFREGPGVVNRLLTIVADGEFNVLNEESSSIENRDYHRVELVVDANSNGGVHDEVADTARMRSLERRILAFCVDDLKFERGSYALRVNPMRGLRGAWHDYQKAAGNSKKIAPVLETSRIRAGSVPLPDEIKSLLDAQNVRRGIFVSDTKERLLRVFFPSKRAGFTYVRIEHNDSPGALMQITSRLANAFDIINSLTRIQLQNRRHHLELLLYSAQFSRPEDEAKRQDIVHELLAEKLPNLELKIWINPSAGSFELGGAEPVRYPLVRFKKTTMVRVSERELGESTRAVLQRRNREYSNRLKGANESSRRDLEPRLRAIQQALAAEGEPRELLKVFVSYDFTRRDLGGAIAKRLKKLGCDMVTGERPADGTGRPIRDVIIERISGADAFLGVWTRRGDTGMSPWLHWELAVAQVNRWPVRLLIGPGVDQRIIPEVHHDQFTDLEFTKVARRSIADLLEEVRQKQTAAPY